MRNNKSQYLSYLFLASIFIITFILNRLYPLFADDWTYSFIFRTDNRIESIKDIFYSQYIHYFIWGGRSVTHFITQFLLLINKNWADLLNSMTYVVLIYIIYVISTESYKLKKTHILYIISALVLLFCPSFIDTILWKTGSANYLWSTLIILMFFRPYIANINKLGRLYINPFILLVGGIIAGWTNENTGFSLTITSLFLIVVYYKKFKHIPIWSICGLIGVIIGFSMMVLAPGNAVRSNAILEQFNNISYLEIIRYRIFNVGQNYALLILPLTFIYLLILTIYGHEKAKHKKVVFNSLVFLFMGHSSALIMILSPAFPERAAFGSIIFIIIAIVILLSNITIDSLYLKRILLSIILLLLIPSFYKYYTIFKDAIATNNDITLINSIVDASKKNNILNVTIYKSDYYISANSIFYNFTADSTFWFNVDYAKYKNINSIIVD